MVDPEFKRIERFIGGLAPQILILVTTSKPKTINEAIDLSVTLTEEAVRLGKFSNSEEKKETRGESPGENKRKFTNFQKVTRADNNKNAKKERGYTGQDGSGNLGGNNDDNNYQGRDDDDQGRGQAYFNCGDVGHFRKYCPENAQAHG
ncbi:uncharacterized protein LOC110876863 [Helianthus annuus]|uniref:uncharacterized protein LOC110876863 n=1 Tax=Helianthus annuus TaxID=4232 RepID=UPI000B90775D|nr:uncharacterized protein LOC110876863 [Helianthus annuus]